MSGTKIINVLKDDRFEDILHIFQSTPSKEVIFVMPLKSRFLNEENHFTVLSAAAEEQNKNILILSSNPQIIELALQYNFGVLSSGKNDKKTPKATPREPIERSSNPQTQGAEQWSHGHRRMTEL